MSLFSLNQSRPVLMLDLINAPIGYSKLGELTFKFTWTEIFSGLPLLLYIRFLPTFLPIMIHYIIWIKTNFDWWLCKNILSHIFFCNCTDEYVIIMYLSVPYTFIVNIHRTCFDTINCYSTVVGYHGYCSLHFIHFGLMDNNYIFFIWTRLF